MCLANFANLANLTNFHIAFSLQTLASNGAISLFVYDCLVSLRTEMRLMNNCI